MTPEQLEALMRWTVNTVKAAKPDRMAFLAQNQFRREMYAAFGFVEGDGEKPRVLQHQDTLPPANIATSDPEGHRQAIADADYDAKYDAIRTLLAKNDPSTPLANAEEIMRLWPELKAIMEPGSLCADQLAKPGGNNDTK